MGTSRDSKMCSLLPELYEDWAFMRGEFIFWLYQWNKSYWVWHAESLGSVSGQSTTLSFFYKKVRFRLRLSFLKFFPKWGWNFLRTFLIFSQKSGWDFLIFPQKSGWDFLIFSQKSGLDFLIFPQSQGWNFLIFDGKIIVTSGRSNTFGLFGLDDNIFYFSLVHLYNFLKFFVPNFIHY